MVVVVGKVSILKIEYYIYIVYSISKMEGQEQYSSVSYLRKT